MHHAFAAVRDHRHDDGHDDAGYGIAVLSRHPIVARHHFNITYGSAREPRGCLHAALDTGGGSPLHVFCVHLGLRYRERHFQMERILSEEIVNSHRYGDGPRILLGDFNNWWPVQSARAVHTHFHDACAITGRKRLRTFGRFFDYLCLDYIFTSRDCEILDLRCAGKGPCACRVGPPPVRVHAAAASVGLTRPSPDATGVAPGPSWQLRSGADCFPLDLCRSASIIRAQWLWRHKCLNCLALTWRGEGITCRRLSNRQRTAAALRRQVLSLSASLRIRRLGNAHLRPRGPPSCRPPSASRFSSACSPHCLAANRFAHAGVAGETNDLLTMEYQQVGACEEEAVRLACIRAVNATIGRMMFSDYKLQAMDLLDPYIQKNYQKFVASTYVLERRAGPEGFGVRIRVQTFPEVVSRDLQEKRFLIMATGNPYFYVFLQDTVGGQTSRRGGCAQGGHRGNPTRGRQGLPVRRPVASQQHECDDQPRRVLRGARGRAARWRADHHLRCCGHPHG